MTTLHMIRFGTLGHVGRFVSGEAAEYPRDTRVVIRTNRGLEVGVVLAPLRTSTGDIDGTLVRALTVEDDLLLARIQTNRDGAFQACQDLLRERGIEATLVDVEQLFDGQSLLFYFLGPVTPRIEALTHELAEAYDAQVQFRRFTDTLLAGCGPDCGTQDATGCGSGLCSTCVAAGNCALQ